MREYSDEEKKLMTKVLPSVAQELRIAMTNMHIAMDRLAPAEKRERDAAVDRNAAVFTQSYFRMTRVIGNLDAAADLGWEGPFPTRVNDDVVGLTRTVCEKAEALFADKGVTLLFESERAGHIILIDAERIERLLYNLLSNALKFTPKGGTVTVRVRVTEPNVLLTVSDTGCGIASDELGQIFDRFLDFDGWRLSPHGIGLGLALCRRIAQGHGGGIAVESKKGKGTRVTVSLPNRRSDCTPVRQPRMTYEGGFNRTLLELSDALDIDAFACRRMD